jgi:integrase
LLLGRGVPVAYVSQQLGHSSIDVTVRCYAHFIPGADRHHVEELVDAIQTARPAAAQRQAIRGPAPRRRRARS